MDSRGQKSIHGVGIASVEESPPGNSTGRSTSREFHPKKGADSAHRDPLALRIQEGLIPMSRSVDPAVNEYGISAGLGRDGRNHTGDLALSICPSAYTSLSVCVCLSICLCLPLYLSVCLSISLCPSLSACLSVHPFPGAEGAPGDGVP